MLRKTGGATSSIVLATNDLGVIAVENGLIGIAGGDALRLSDGDRLEGVARVGGAIDVDGEATLVDFVMRSGRIEGDGDVTLDGASVVEGGIIAGSGALRVPEAASLRFGPAFDPEAFNPAFSVQLGRTPELSGAVDHANATIVLGDRLFDPDAGVTVDLPGRIEIAEEGRYVFTSPAAGMREVSSVAGNGVVNAGVIEKTGGGASSIILIGDGSGDFVFDDGTLEIASGDFTITQALVDAGFDDIVVSAVVLTLEPGLSLDRLSVKGGVVRGDGAVTVSELELVNGLLALDGPMTIPAGGVARIGDDLFFSSPRIAGDVAVAGDVFLSSSARLTLGARVDTGAGFENRAGLFTLAPTGRVDQRRTL